MDSEIIEVIDDSEENNSNNGNLNEHQQNFFELITRYYQILFNVLENSSSE